MSVAKLRWYAARLSAMSPPEVAHRVRELALKRLWRGNTRGWDNFSNAGDGPLADLSALRAALARGAGRAPAALAALEAGRLCGLGRQVDAHLGPALWFVDPVSQRAWPGADTYCFDVDVRSTGVGLGDVKFVWEINRLQFLHPLAAEIAAAPSARDIRRAMDWLAAWAAANPPFRGVNWFSGIELAMRMVTVTLLVAAIPHEMVTGEDRALLRRLIAAHAFWLHRYPSRFSSANNHLVAEGLGLFLAGLLAPDAAHAAEYAAEGRRILETEAALQLLPDGVGAEQSPTYQAFTMEMLAFAALVAEGHGAPLAPVVGQRLAEGARFLKSLMDTNGAVPLIGDDDEGRVLAAPPDREPRYVASVVAAVAGLTDRPDRVPPARDPHWRDALFAAPATGADAPDGLSLFPDGGYAVGRVTVDGTPAVLTLDHGPLGYLKLAAHGHADTLALWLSVGGQPVLVDAGTYLYHSGGVVRNRLRSSLAHNTLSVQDASSSVPSSAFSWSSRAAGRLDEVVDGPWWQLTASHDGYERRFGLRHQRSVSREPRGFLITDRLVGAKSPVTVRIGFLVHPGLEGMLEADRFVIRGREGVLATLHLPPGLRALIVRGDEQSGAGFHAPRFGTIETATQLVLTGERADDPIATRIEIAPLRR